jgi:hypothetical protein
MVVALPPFGEPELIMLDRMAERYGKRPSEIAGWSGPLGLALDFEAMEAGTAAAQRALGDKPIVFPIVRVG